MAGNLVPRTDGESNLGTALKEYGKLFVKELAGTAATIYAKLASPAFTGTPTAPTAAHGTSTTQLATTKFVVDEIASELDDKVRLKDTSKRDTAYSTGATVTMPGIPVDMFLECSTAGTTDSTVPVITQPVSEGTTISDGSVVWTVRKTNSISNTLNMGVFNHKETFTSSGSFTAPVTGTYRITLQGGGGGGAGASNNAGYALGNIGGGGGAAGAVLTFYEALTAGTSYSYTIGAGGSGSGQTTGGTGGDSSITINGHTYLCQGGNGGYSYQNKGAGGSPVEAKIDGVTVAYSRGGEPQSVTQNNNVAIGGNGGGHQGGQGGINAGGQVGHNGCGGGGGAYNNGVANGASGGDGYIAFEYCDL